MASGPAAAIPERWAPAAWRPFEPTTAVLPPRAAGLSIRCGRWDWIQPDRHGRRIKRDGNVQAWRETTGGPPVAWATPIWGRAPVEAGSLDLVFDSRERAGGGLAARRTKGHGTERVYVGRLLPSIRNRGKRDSPTRGARRAAIGGEGGGDQLSGGGFFSRRDLLREVASA
jgi:hypothetical protein